MKLDRFKNAWQMLCVRHNLDLITEGEIMNIIKAYPLEPAGYSIWQNALLFVLLLLGCVSG